MGGLRQNTPLLAVAAGVALLLLVLVLRKQCPALVEDATPETQPTGDESAAALMAEDDASTGPRVRPSPFAGSWYSSGRDRLHGEIHEFLEGADPYDGARPLALLCPHAGYRFSGPTAAWAYRALDKERFDRVFILGPSHSHPLSGIGIGPWTHYDTPMGQVPVDQAAVERLTQHPRFSVVEGVDAKEHSLEMEVPFLQVTAMGSSIVPMVVGDLDAEGIEDVAGALRAELGPGDLLVVSSDFGHYGRRFGYTPDLGEDTAAGIRALDMGAFEAFSSLDLGRFLSYKEDTGITVCGFRPMAILQAMLPEGASVVQRHYDTSGQMTGDWANSVSYLSAVATGPLWDGRGADQTTWRFGLEEQQTLLQLARDSIRARLDGGGPPDLSGYDITDEMRKDSGAFVTLTIGGHLRGCIGEIPPSRSLADVVRDHAVDAGFRDPRFSPLSADEYDGIHIEISVLTPPEPVAGYQDIVLGRDGIYLIKGMRRAVYLPQVAVEQGWNLDETLSTLSRKAGLPTNGWKEGATFEVFQAQVFHE